MVGYRVVKSHFGFEGNIYSKGEIVELSDEDALYYLAQNVVVSTVETRLTSESDGLFAEQNKKVGKLEETVKKLASEVSRLTELIKAKDLLIANLNSKKK